MMPVVFAHTEYVYESYQDYRRLVELAGFETCFVRDIDLNREAVFITSPVNGELRPHVTHRRSLLNGPQKCRIIWFNLERIDSGQWGLDNIGRGVSNCVNDILKYVDHVWVSDRYYASLDNRQIFVEPGSDARLASGPPEPEKAFDIAHLSYAENRRNAIYGPLQQQGLRFAPNAWGAERDRILRTSRSMLYVHQTPAPIGAPLRFALAAAYRTPLLSENMADPYPLVPGRDLMMCGYNDLVANVPRWLSSSDLPKWGENLHHTLCVGTNFRKSVEDGIRRTFA